jgi:ABC-type multidrug transport system permease subunit
MKTTYVFFGSLILYLLTSLFISATVGTLIYYCIIFGCGYFLGNNIAKGENHGTCGK